MRAAGASRKALAARRMQRSCESGTSNSQSFQGEAMKPRNRLPPRPGAKLQPRQVPLAIGWYSEAEWRQVKAAATDAERFEQTFQAWETMAERALNDLRAQGLRPTRFNIIANDLLAWCLVRNKENDAAARALFVSEQVAISSKQQQAAREPPLAPQP